MFFQMAIINWQLRSASYTTDIYYGWILIVEISWPGTLYYSMLSLDHISSSELVQYSLEQHSPKIKTYT